MSVGLELSQSMVRAVRVDQDGRVIARSDRPIVDGGLARAIREAIGESGGKKGTPNGCAGDWLNGAPPPDVAAAIAEGLSRSDAIGIPVGTAVAIAESWCGAARDVKHVVTFAVGEHVSAGIIIGGEIWTGAHGWAGSVGWLTLNPVERADYRRFGGLEAEVAAAGLVRRLVLRVKSGDYSDVVKQVGGDLARLNAEIIFDGARSGDGVCISVVRDTVKYVGMAVANLAAIVDPELIVLGGMLAASNEMMLDAVRTECARRLRPAQAERLRMVLSPLGADAAAIGAARAAMLRSA